MSEICFVRSVSFEARHHYHVDGWDEATNRARFGTAAEPHEHEWTLTLWLSGPVDPLTGMVVDLVLLDKLLYREVVAPFSGASFREGDPAFFAESQPTTEVLAGYFAKRLIPGLPVEVKLAKLRIAEMADLYAEWQP